MGLYEARRICVFGAALGPHELVFDATVHRALLPIGPICMVLSTRDPSSSPQPKGRQSKSGVSSRSRYLSSPSLLLGAPVPSRHKSLPWAR